MYIYMDIVEGFQCEMCGRCCRNDWMVTLNEESYRRNFRLFAEQGRQEEFAVAFRPIDGERCLGEYAYIAKQPNGGCWFLEEDQRCRLHRQVGHQHLDSVCQTFPRYPISSARGIELTLTLNCPAVQKRLNRVAPLEVRRSAEAPLEIEPDSIVAHIYPQQRKKNDPLHYYFELEQHCIDLLQWRNRSLDERLELLRQTFSKLANTDCENMGDSVRAIIYENYETMDAEDRFEVGEMVTAEILQEHFLVNLIFQKVLYLYGLQQGLQLLLRFREQLMEAEQRATGDAEKREAVRAVIMELSFQHSHNRNELQQG